MHISEGVLTAPVLGAGAALTVVGLAVGLKKMDYEKLPEVGVLSSVFFVASLIHVPIGPSAAHLILNGLCGILLGWLAFPAIFVGLTLQAVLFGFGGLTTLGVNTLNMAFPAVALGFLCGRFVTSPKVAVRVAAEFLAGAGAILCSGLMVAGSLVLALGESIDSAARLIVLAHIPIMIIEGFITVFAVEFIRKVKPEMLSGPTDAVPCQAG
jgi:cobalt/nickel transport system permease protein